MFWHKFQQIVETYPNKVAILDRGQEVSYWELCQRAVAIGESLTVSEETCIGIEIDKSADYIVALLGVWYAGAAFVPLPPCLPEARKRFICQDADIRKVLTGQDTKNRIETSNPVQVQGNTLAYIMYTSGSTGEPKGVMVEHHGILNFIEAQIEAFQTKPESQYLFYLSTAFDASLSDIGVALLSGSTLVIEDQDDLRDGKKFIEILKKREITHTDIPPSLLNILSPDQMPITLETLIIGGEVCPPKIVRQWAEKFRVINVYGPTETTVCTSLCQCDPENWEKPLIGNPFEGVDYKVIDEELYIGGLQVARGYVNKRSLTAEKFVMIEGQRFYRTGDRVHQNTDGAIEFLGRIDRQFKLRGQLVEPEEIEKQLVQHPDIQKAAVLKRSLRSGGHEALVAFVTGKPTEDLNVFLSTNLPDWMIPQHIEYLTEMPETVTGKIDLAVLKKKDLKLIKRTYQKPATELEEKIYRVWAKLLKQENFGTTDNFFEIGGDSLSTINLTLVAEQYGLSISPALLVDYPTIEKLSKALEEKRTGGALSCNWIKQDVRFDADWQSLFEHARQRPVQKQTNEILLTGATGFLGGRLLEELLEKTEATIYCLVRNPARLKIQNNRVRPVVGDLTQENFGWKQDKWDSLSKEIDTIYHCAAWVNVVQDYQAMRASNVGGTQEILRFACTGNRKKIHYASTLSVFVATDQNSGTVYETDRLEKTQVVYGGYAQTKWAAEYILLQVPKDVCDVTHYRFGLITGDTETGICSETDFLKMFVKGLISLGFMPEEFGRILKIDITPVDYAVTAMAQLSLTGKGEIYHIANPQSLSLVELVELIGGIQQLPVQKWKQKFKNKDLTTAESATYLALCRCLDNFDAYRTMDLFQATNIVFDMTQTDKDYGVTCPKPTEKLLKTYLDFIFKNTLKERRVA